MNIRRRDFIGYACSLCKGQVTDKPHNGLLWWQGCIPYSCPYKGQTIVGEAKLTDLPKMEAVFSSFYKGANP